MFFTLHPQFNSVQFSRSVVSNSLRPHGLEHTRLPCPSPTPRACSNSHPLNWWYHPTISSSVIPFFSCLQSFPASGSFQRVSSLHQVAKVLEFQLQLQFQLQEYSFFPVNIQDGFPLGLTGWISLLSKGLSRVFPPAPQFESIRTFVLSSLYDPTLTSIHDYWKNYSFD